jgi:small subunit ribosomal protein S1
MNIEVAKSSGFCVGVKNAVETANQTISIPEEHPGGIFMYGKIIHNQTVIDEMKEKGIRIAESLDDIENGSKVLIRTHGIPPQVKDQLIQMNCELIDCTCPFVKRIHQIVKEAYEQGKLVILIGDPSHPEIIGINGECNHCATVIYDSSQAKKLTFEDKPTILAAQTTFSHKIFHEIIDILKKKIALLEIFDTICITTEKRQQEAEELSSRSDLMIVIGSKMSSNTMKLFDLCRQHCDSTYLVENLTEMDEILQREDLQGRRIGVIAGASTPQRIIGEVINKMSEKKGTESQLEKDNLYFSEYIDSISQLHRGSTVIGAVIRYDNEYVYIDVRDKSEGKIPLHEFKDDSDFDLDDAVNNHKEIDVFVRSIRNTDMGKEILLSKARVDFSKNKDFVEKAYLDKEPVNVTITKSVKDGVIGSVGNIDIYIHKTQLEHSVVEDLDRYIGTDIEILITQFDTDKRRLRVSGSRRTLLNQERKEKSEQLWVDIEIGKEYTGIVRSLTDFGAFVDIGGIDGLIHVSELSWNRIRHPSEIVRIGDEVNVYIKDFDQEKHRISLGYKKMEDDPYIHIDDKYPVGSVITGKVVRMFPFGAFIELEPGIDALCHISQISNYRLVKPSEVLDEGMEVTVKVLEVNSESRRISVSIKEVEPIDPINQEPEEETSTDEPSGEEEQKIKNPISTTEENQNLDVTDSTKSTEEA